MEEEKGEELGSIIVVRPESRDGLESAQSGKGSVVLHRMLH